MSTGSTAGEVDHRADGLLTVDLAAIVANYRLLAATAPSAQCAAVVKADAYGLGTAQVAPALHGAGCRTFFVAHVDEGLALRAQLGSGAAIAVFHGVPAGAEAICRARDLTPVLNSRAQWDAWSDFARAVGEKLPAILQVDSGMTRFGLSRPEFDALLEQGVARAGLDLRLLMSHLCCADTPDHPSNAAQRAAFAGFRRRLPDVPASLAASSGIFLGIAFHADLVRPGAALYGVAPQMGVANPLRPVVRLQGRVVQMRDVPAGTAVGYGHTATTQGAACLAVVAVGYADGLLRSSAGRGAAWYGPTRLPIIGRVSMDSIIVDASALPPEALKPGAFVDLIGPYHDVDAVARAAGTIGYEILTSLGHRYHRIYTGAEA